MNGASGTSPPLMPHLLVQALEMPWHRWRYLALISAFTVYAFMGSPTPDSYGPGEIIIGFLIVLAAWSGDIKQALIPCTGREKRWVHAGRFLLIYGTFIPLIIGAFSGHSIEIMVRDYIPFLFLLMPLIFKPLLEKQKRPELLIGAALVIGVSFAVRGTAQTLAALLDLEFLNSIYIQDPFSYLTNAPTVLFSALFLTGTAGTILLMRRMRLKTLVPAVLMLALSMPLFLAMAITMQRAGFAAIGFAVLIWLLAAFRVNPLRSLRVLIPASALVLFSFPFLHEIALSLWEKTGQVGLNMRERELFAVWDTISQNPLSIIFGIGWGGMFASPVTEGLHVNFTHSLISSMLLKTGLAGVMIGAFYIVEIGRILATHMRKDPVLTLSLGAPFMIDVFLYASFKSLDFGLLLLMITFTLKNRSGAFKNSGGPIN